MPSLRGLARQTTWSNLRLGRRGGPMGWIRSIAEFFRRLRHFAVVVAARVSGELDHGHETDL
ncbi:hypothetical protein HYZ80_01190 [Candidatus Parcubacteria bacterium]|nr:hypothetical protein [Candidatus Parcubacteria bacterium]